MSDLYPTIKALHVLSVVTSIALFALRGALVLGGAGRLGNHALPRYLSYTVDTFLLTFALMLWAMLQIDPLAQPWLATKLLLLPIYIVLGSFAVKRAKTRRLRAISYAAALCVAFLMYGIATAHHPLGWLSSWPDD